MFQPWTKSGFIYTYSLGDLYPLGFPGGSAGKEPPEGDARDRSSIPGSGRSPGEGNGYPLQYPCLGNSMDRGAWQGLKESDMTE